MLSIIWIISIALFLGGIGLPIPENPLLMGGGYVIYIHGISPITSICLWYMAILLGDIILFGSVYWLLNRPACSSLLKKYIGEKRVNKYKAAFSSRGGITLFLARFTFGIRTVAYIAAGAAHYPWLRFLAVDGISVAIQVLLLVGIGYYAGGSIGWAESTGEKIAFSIAILALICILIMWGSSIAIKKLTSRKNEINDGRNGNRDNHML